MFKKILGKSKEESSEDKEHRIIVEKISKMNLTDMRQYVNNKLSNFPVCEDGLGEVMRKLNSQDLKTSKRFIEDDAMDSKKQKAFDIVILIGTNKKTTIVVIEQIQEFIEIYKDIIAKYDTEHSQIYGEKLNSALKASITTVATMAEMNKKMRVIGS